MTHRNDLELIRDTRAGQRDAFGILYARHLAAAQRLAARESDNPSDREDVVAQAFTSILRGLQTGKGPERTFLPYLLTTVQRIAHRSNKQARRTRTIEPAQEPATYDPDPLKAAIDDTALLEVFGSLPVRWQQVLLHVDLENNKPATIAPLLGMSPNAVSALLYRAREGLRSAYLQAHAGPAVGQDCARVIHHLGTYLRGRLPATTRPGIEGHLAGCQHCTAIAEHLQDLRHLLHGGTAY